MTRFYGLILSLTLITVADYAIAQDRFYHIYVDTDNNTATGCDVDLTDFTTAINGTEGRVTITTNSNQPPSITSTAYHSCDGTNFDNGINISPAALGLNSSMNGSDVFEAEIPQSILGINSSTSVVFYYVTDSDTASDIVLSNSNGGPITLGFAFAVPALGFFALGLMLLGFLCLTQRNISKKMSLMLLFIGFSSVVWAMSIVVDGQTSDWNNINPENNDPINDTSAPGSFADLTQVYLTEQNDIIYFRMDVLDLENQAPIADDASDTTLEDNSVTITVTGSDAENEPLTFSVDTPPNNGTLSVFTVVNDTTSTVEYTPNADFNGNDTFSFVANDGQVNSGPGSVDITVTGVNDEPTFTSGGNVNQLKTAGAYNQVWASNISTGAVNESAQNLSFNILSNDNAAIFTTQPSLDSAGVLTFEGVTDASGTANLTVNLTDDGGTANGGDDTSITETFTITLQGVNDEPSFTAGGDVIANEDAGAQTVAAWATNISAGPADEAGQSLTFNITVNDNPSLFIAGPSVDPVTGDLTYTTAPDANGLSNISIELMDDGGTADGGDDTSPSASFNITVVAINDSPTFIAGADQSVLEGAGAQTVNNWATGISPGPADEVTQNVTFTVLNDNNTLFNVQPAIDPAGNLTYTTNPTGIGSATVSVSITDDGGTANGGVDTSAVQTFTINITEVNDEPSFTAGPDQNVLEDAGAQTIAAWATAILAGPPDEIGQVLTFNITANDNVALFSTAPVVNPLTGDLTYTPADDANGTANITLVLMDDGGTANGGDDTSTPANFSITVIAVNDEPTFTAGANQSVQENSGAQTVNGWATAISVGPADEASQTGSFNVTNNNNALFSTQPAIDATGNLTFTPATNVSGSATVSVELMDDGGTANGGIDTSATQTFTITVNFINDAPSFTVGADQTVAEDAGAQTVIGWATSISAGPPDEAGQVVTFNITGNTNAALFSSGPIIAANGDLTYTPADDANGSATITLVLMDDGGTANGGVDTSPPQSFDITVNAVNDAPDAIDDTNTTSEDSALTVAAAGVLANDTDPDTGDSLIVIGFDAFSSNGATVTVNADGSYSYDPNGLFEFLAVGESTTDTFTYTISDGNGGTDTATVTITINGANDTPNAIDDTNSTSEDGVLTVAAAGVLANDTDSDAGDTLTVISFDALSSNGATVTVNPDGSYSYDPNGQIDALAVGESTIDTFTYTIGDGNGGTDTATVVITINGANDTPNAIDDTNSTSEDGVLTVAAAGVLANDTDSDAGDTLTVISFDALSSNGATVTVNPDGSYSYDPNGQFESLAVGESTIDTFTYTIGDGNGGTDTATVIISIIGANDAPNAIDDNNMVLADAILNVVAAGVLVNDSDPDTSDTFTVISFDDSSTLGNVTVNADGSFSYDPNGQFNTLLVGQTSLDSFNYTITDGNGGTDTATVTITVQGVLPINTAPTGVNDAYPVTGNIGINVPTPNGVTSNDTDPESDPLTVTAFDATSTQGGSVSVNANGSFTYNPPAGFTGSDSFGYTVSDGSLTDTATVALTVANKVWFIDNTAAGGGDGDLQTPFNSLSAFNASAAPAAGDSIYLATGSGIYTEAGITLANNQILFGQGATGTFDINAGITLATFSNTTPTLGGTRPIIISTANGINLASGNTLRGMDVGNTTGIGVTGTVVGTLTVNELAINGTGGAINIGTSGDLSAANFDTINVTPAAGQDGIRLRGLTGTLTFANPINLNGTSGRGFDFDASTAAVSITNTLDIDTTTGIGFNAVNGGSISVTGANSSVNTTNGRAVNINATSIAASNVTFQSVNSGAANDLGINLVSTGTAGGFRITGIGATAGSGGTISNKTGTDVAIANGTGIYMQNTANVQLALMQMNDFDNFAIRGNNVTGFSLIDSVINGNNGNSSASDEAAIRFNNLSGVSILSGNSISGGIEDQIRIINAADSLDLTINDSSNNQAVIGLDGSPASFNGNDGLLLETSGNAIATILVNGVEFSGARGDNIQTNALGTSMQTVSITNNTFNNTHPNIAPGGGGVTLSGAGTGAGINIIYTVAGNTFNNANGNALTSNYVSGSGAVAGTIDGNMIGTMGASSGSVNGSGISVGTAQNIAHSSTVNNNTVANIDGFAGLDFAHDGNGVFNSNVTNNDVSGLGGFALSAMNSTLAGGGIATGTACLDIENNNLDASGATFGLNAIFIDQLNGAATYNLPGFTGSPNGEFAIACVAGTASIDGHGLLNGQGNTFINGAFPSFPGIMLDSSLVCGMTGVGTTCP